MIERMERSAEELAKLIQEGLATEDDRGLVLRAIQVGLGSTLATQVTALGKLIDREIALFNRFEQRYEELVEEELQKPDIKLQQIGNEADRLYQRIYKSLDLARQIVQGKCLFPQDTYSANDRKVLLVLSSIKNNEQRKRFYAAIDHFMSLEGFTEYEEVETK